MQFSRGRAPRKEIATGAFLRNKGGLGIREEESRWPARDSKKPGEDRKKRLHEGSCGGGGGDLIIGALPEEAWKEKNA